MLKGGVARKASVLVGCHRQWIKIMLLIERGHIIATASKAVETDISIANRVLTRAKQMAVSCRRGNGFRRVLSGRRVLLVLKALKLSEMHAVLGVGGRIPKIHWKQDM